MHNIPTSLSSQYVRAFSCRCLLFVFGGVGGGTWARATPITSNFCFEMWTVKFHHQAAARRGSSSPDGVYMCVCVCGRSDHRTTVWVGTGGRRICARDSAAQGTSGMSGHFSRSAVGLYLDLGRPHSSYAVQIVVLDPSCWGVGVSERSGVLLDDRTRWQRIRGR